MYITNQNMFPTLSFLRLSIYYQDYSSMLKNDVQPPLRNFKPHVWTGFDR